MESFGNDFLHTGMGLDQMLGLNSVDLVAQISTGFGEESEMLPAVNNVNAEEVVVATNIRSQQQQQQQQVSATTTAQLNSSSPYVKSPQTDYQSLMKSNEAAESEPYVHITEEPRQRGLRFRYPCEGRSAGSIPGQNSTAERKTFPTIRIMNHTGPAIVVVSCVTKDHPHKPHPHALVGKDCKKGVCTVKVKDTSIINFQHLGIQCAKKKDVPDSLNLRKGVNVDPFQTGFDHPISSGDMSVVRLCFQVFLPDKTGKITKVLQPVVSQAIHDKKALNDLVICRVDKSSGKACGGDEVFLLCEKVNKDDIGVKFYEERHNGSIDWENYGDFGAADVHRQFALVFKTPAYKDSTISRPVKVFMQLFRPSDNETSEAIPFIYMPEDPDPDRIAEKKRRKAPRMNHLVNEMNVTSKHSGANLNIKEGLRSKLTANRKIQSRPTSEIKMESDTQSPALPAYTLTNISSTGFVPHTMSRPADNYIVENSIPHPDSMQGLRINYGATPTGNESVIPVPNPETTLFDPSTLDPDVLSQYFRDNNLDMLSFESLDMLSGNTVDMTLQGVQNVGANEFIDGTMGGGNEIMQHMDSGAGQGVNNI